MRRLRMPVGLTLLALLLPLGLPARADDRFDAERRVYKAYLKRPSLFMRTRGRTRFAHTRYVEALEILAKSYGSPEEPKDRVPHLIAAAATRGCRGAEAASRTGAPSGMLPACRNTSRTRRWSWP